MNLARSERAALADLFTEVGPDQPTLCQGWAAADLLVHLLIRERRPDAALGIMIPPLAGRTARVSAAYRRRPFGELVDRFRGGPPKASPLSCGPVDEKVNGGEMFIHHEDLRRGRPDWQPRKFDEDTRTQLISLLTSPLVLRALRKAGVPTTARLTDEPGSHQRPLILVPSKTPGEDGSHGVVVRGDVGDILLWLSGRTAVRVEFDGSPADVAAVQASNRAL